jgi:hypothetical protein
MGYVARMLRQWQNSVLGAPTGADQEGLVTVLGDLPPGNPRRNACIDSSTLLKSALATAVSTFTSFEAFSAASMTGCENARNSVPLATKRRIAPRASSFAVSSLFA